VTADLHPRLIALFEKRWPRPPADDDGWQAWYDKRQQFYSLLAINIPEALTGAAMLCVPEGWFIGAIAEPDPAQGKTDCYAALVQNEMTDVDRGYGQPPDEIREVAEARAPTPAEALVAAIEQAMEVGGE